MTLLALRTGRLAVDLAPEAGGSIARFTVAGSADVLRPATDRALTSQRGNDTACYPLVPYSNRIANGRFMFEGREIVVPANWPGVRHPMHGDGWSQPWTVVKSDARSATIVYEHDGRRGWPFRYRARQQFSLSEQALDAAISVENLEGHAVPAGLGLHPFFVREADCELFFRADNVWLADAEVLPTSRIVVPDAWDFEHGRRPDDVALDNCFADWDGEATIRWPGRGLSLAVEASQIFRQLVIYTPPGQPFFCAEPVSHANGAIGRTRLEAGATLAGTVSFKVFQQ
jgi:aldose 1-epimerase